MSPQPPGAATWHPPMQLAWWEAGSRDREEVAEHSQCCLSLDRTMPEAGTPDLFSCVSQKIPLVVDLSRFDLDRCHWQR